MLVAVALQAKLLSGLYAQNFHAITVCLGLVALQALMRQWQKMAEDIILQIYNFLNPQ